MLRYHHPGRSSATVQTPVGIESLEERRFLSAAPAFASLSRGGTLTVSGTRRADVMYVSLERRHPGTLDAVVNGQVLTFNAAKVKNVFLVGGQGNDNLIIDDSHGVIGGNHQLFGGGGDDILRGNARDDSLFGEAGDDSLLGGAGDDRLDGGDGNDDCDGGSGSDHVRGGNGVDHFHGTDDTTAEIEDHTTEDVGDDHGGAGGSNGGSGNSGSGGGGADDPAGHHAVTLFANDPRNDVLA